MDIWMDIMLGHMVYVIRTYYTKLYYTISPGPAWFQEKRKKNLDVPLGGDLVGPDRTCLNLLTLFFANFVFGWCLKRVIFVPRYVVQQFTTNIRLQLKTTREIYEPKATLKHSIVDSPVPFPANVRRFRSAFCLCQHRFFFLSSGMRRLYTQCH